MHIYTLYILYIYIYIYLHNKNKTNKISDINKNYY